MNFKGSCETSTVKTSVTNIESTDKLEVSVLSILQYSPEVKSQMAWILR